MIQTIRETLIALLLYAALCAIAFYLLLLYTNPTLAVLIFAGLAIVWQTATWVIRKSEVRQR